jgi:hypothetical protein
MRARLRWGMPAMTAWKAVPCNGKPLYPCRMLKLIGIILAALPVIVFVRAIFLGSRGRSQAMSDFRKQVDYAVWAILFMIGVGLVFSVGKLIYDLGLAAPGP